MAQNLTPEQLQMALALRSRPGFNPDTTGYAYDPQYQSDDPRGFMLYNQLGYDYGHGDGGENMRNRAKDSQQIMRLRPDTAGNLGDWWNTDGTYGGEYQAQNGGGKDMNQAIALMLGGYFGGGAAFGADGAAAGGGLAATGGADAATSAAWGSGAGLGGDTLSAMGATGGTGAADGGLTVSQLLSGAKKAYDTVGGAKGVATLLGAAAGAADGGDKTQASNRDPWGPAQDALKGLLREGNDLYGQYKQQPFSRSQQAAYANTGGLLDLLNQNAGGLLQGFQANGSGANQFVRGQPQRSLIGSSFNPTQQQWQPSLLGNFGTGGK